MAAKCAADSFPYRILIRVSDACGGIEKKLEKYFQNTSKSGGGGKCRVRAGPTDSTFWVEFNRKQAKDGVLAKKNHSVAITEKLCVKVFVEPNDVEVESNSNAPAPRTYIIATPFVGEKSPSDIRALIPPNFFLQKVYLQVEAQLTFKLSRSLKEIILTLSPNVKIKGGEDGPERLIGDFEDIEKIYHYLTDTMIVKDQRDDYSYSASAREVDKPTQIDQSSVVLYQYPSAGGENYLDRRSVPENLYDYFKYYFAETLDRLEVEHEVRIKSVLVYPTGSVSLDFETNKEWDRESAKEAFTNTFRRELESMASKEIPGSSHKVVLEMQKTLSDTFKNIHVKAEDKDLVLVGSKPELLKAQKFIKENYILKDSGEAATSVIRKRGIEVDTAHWRVLGQEIRELEKTYCIVMELVHKTKTQKTLIVFRPRDKDLDLTERAYEDFLDLFKKLLPQVVTEVLTLKPIDLKRMAWLATTFCENLEKKHPHILLEGNIKELFVTGLPKYVEKAVKYIRKYFTIENSVEKLGSALSLGEH